MCLVEVLNARNFTPSLLHAIMLKQRRNVIRTSSVFILRKLKCFSSKFSSHLLGLMVSDFCNILTTSINISNSVCI